MISIAAGAFFRSFSLDAPHPSGADSAKRLVCVNESSLSSEDHSYEEKEFPSSDGSSRLASGESGKEVHRSSPPANTRKQSPQTQEKFDLDSVKKGIYPRKSAPGDMTDYLDEAERARKTRIRKFFQEIRQNTKEWERNVFEPTW